MKPMGIMILPPREIPDRKVMNTASHVIRITDDLELLWLKDRDGRSERVPINIQNSLNLNQRDFLCRVLLLHRNFDFDVSHHTIISIVDILDKHGYNDSETESLNELARRVRDQSPQSIKELMRIPLNHIP